MDIDSAHTWFFESLWHEHLNTVVIGLVEGIKLPVRELVVVDEQNTLGPYFPVKVLAESRYLEIVFEGVLSYQVVDESFAAPQSELSASTFSGPVQVCEKLAYLRYIETDSLLLQTLHGEEYSAYFIWTEDQTLFVVSRNPPSVQLVDKAPNLSIERGQSFAAT